MSKRRVCDICGNIITYREYRIKMKEIIHDIDTYGNSMDMCGECQRDFVEFVKQKREKNEL